MGEYSDGFAAPILWGARMGFAIDEIAAGLEIDRSTVIDVIESFTSIRFPVAARSRVLLGRREVPRIDPDRTDPAYRAWATAQRGAAATLEALGAR